MSKWTKLASISVKSSLALSCGKIKTFIIFAIMFTVKLWEPRTLSISVRNVYCYMTNQRQNKPQKLYYCHSLCFFPLASDWFSFRTKMISSVHNSLCSTVVVNNPFYSLLKPGLSVKVRLKLILFLYKHSDFVTPVSCIPVTHKISKYAK